MGIGVRELLALPGRGFGIYLGMFLAAFVVATIFPAQSELLLGTLLLNGSYSASLLLAVATAANVLGSVANWALGHFLADHKNALWSAIR